LESHKQTLTVNGKNIRITIPAGVENGQTIKIAGHGGPGANGGPGGDLYIKFLVLMIRGLSVKAPIYIAPPNWIFIPPY
jgi:DnaJ-class molecular chaperone